MLDIKDLQVEVEGKNVISGLNLNVPVNEIHVIMGLNGAGKSTICKTIMSHPDYKVNKGSIKFLGEDITNMPTNDISKKGIFYLMQNPTEISGVTNAEMLRSSLSDRGIKESIFEFNKRITEAADKLNIDKSFIHHNINERMSGGEKKKNELLQLYVFEPKLILLDELDSGLDVDALKGLSKGILDYKKTHECSIILITHHNNILKYIKPDKVHILNDGHIIESGDISLADKIEKMGFKEVISIDSGAYHE